MTDTTATNELFFTRAGMDRTRVQGVVDEALSGADDGELFLEYCQSESLVFDDGRLKSANFDQTQGFGLRAVSGEATGYAHASELSEDAIRRAAETVRAVHGGTRRNHGGRPGPDQPAPLQRGQPAFRGPVRRQGQASGRHRRLCARPRRAGAAGLRLPRRRMAGSPYSARRRRTQQRHSPPRSSQRLGRGRRR